MNIITLHIRDGEPNIVTLPEGVEVEIVDFDADGGVGRRIRFFVYDGDIMEDIMDPPNIVEGQSG